MPALPVDQELANAFLGALLTVCRADGEVNSEEFDALRSVAAELVPAAAVDDDALLFANVTPESLAEVVHRGRGDGPFRGSASRATEIRVAFIRAAILVARADGDVADTEARAILRFGSALGYSTHDLHGFDATLDERLRDIQN
jgi:uncharacterized tellurite resistance protein B-like protein